VTDWRSTAYPPRGRTVALAVAVLAALLTGCSSGGSEDPQEPASADRTLVVTPDPLPPRVELSFTQQRIREGTRRARVRVANGTDRALRVTRVGLGWPGYAGRLQAEPYTVPAGQVIDLPYRLPRAVCTGTAGRAPMYGVVATRSGEIRRRLEPDGVRFLRRIWRSECDTRRVRRSVRLAWDVAGSPAATETGSGLTARRRIHLVLTRVGGQAPVRVEQAQGSVLFELSLPDTPALAAASARTRAPVTVSPGRCDEHGRSQSTQTWGWRVWVALAGREPVAVLVPPARPQQATLLAFLDRACGDLTAS
jgi:hypothetical protein